MARNIAREKVIGRSVDLQMRWAVNVDYDRGGCTEGCESYCRCNKICNIRIEDTNGVGINCIYIYDHWLTKAKNPAERKTRYKPTEIENYCLGRLLTVHHAYDASNYEVGVTRGYYGEEIDDVEFHGDKALKDDIIKLMSLKTDLAKVLFVINKEYSYLLPEIEKATGFEIVNLDFKFVARNNEYFSRVKNDVAKGYNDMSSGEDLPVGILYKNRLIDGYHRVATGIANKKKSGKFIALLVPETLNI